VRQFLGILVNGQFECFGNIQHLKARYGNGYTLVLKCKISDSTSETSDGGEISMHKNELIVKNCMKFIRENMPNAILKDRQQQTLFYQILFNNNEMYDSKSGESSLTSIAKIFSLIETNKDNLELETYLLSQTTLEQIFISFAKKQVDRSNNNGKYETDSVQYNVESDNLTLDNNSTPNETAIDIDRIVENESTREQLKRTYVNRTYIRD
jgi:hypothetical protein